MNLNDQIVAYLASKNITPNQGDYQTVSTNGIESISIWNTAALGAQPTSDQLQEAYISWQLQQAKAAQNQILYNAYQSAITQSVSYTSKGGISKKYQADPISISNLQASLLGCQATQTTPDGFFWLAEDNTQVPFTYVDMQGLAQVFFAQGATAFAKLQALKAAVLTATTLSAIQAINW